MSKSYINVPMSDAEKQAFEASDAYWTGPKLILLLAVTLSAALLLLTSLAWRWIGPQQGDTLAPQHHVSH